MAIEPTRAARPELEDKRSGAMADPVMAYPMLVLVGIEYR
jgi:hypothetical protein